MPYPGSLWVVNLPNPLDRRYRTICLKDKGDGILGEWLDFGEHVLVVGVFDNSMQIRCIRVKTGIEGFLSLMDFRPELMSQVAASSPADDFGNEKSGYDFVE